MRLRATHWALVPVAAFPLWALAQAPEPARVAPELRADAVLSDQSAVHVGAGVQIPIGYYVRIGVVGAGGVRGSRVSSSGPVVGSGRIDVLARFLLDPFRQSPYGLSLGGGVSFLAQQGDRVRPVLLVAADVEGSGRSGGVVPAIQVGLGSGVRLGIILRRTPSAGAR